MPLFKPSPRAIRNERTAAAEHAAIASDSVTDGLLLALMEEIRGLRSDLKKAQEKTDRYRAELGASRRR